MRRPAGLDAPGATGGRRCRSAPTSWPPCPRGSAIPDSVAAYVAAADTQPTVVATLDGRDCGILTLRVHSPYAAEIVVMGVLPEHHRTGIGRALLAAPSPGWPSATSSSSR